MSENEINSKDSELEDIMNEIESLENDFPNEDASNELSKLIVEAEEEVSKAMQAESIEEVIEEPAAELIDDIVAVEEAVVEEIVEEPAAEKVSEPMFEGVEDIVAEADSPTKDSLSIQQDEVSTTKLQNTIDAEMEDILNEHAVEIEEPVMVEEHEHIPENVVEMAAPEKVVEAPIVPAMEPGEGAQTSMTFSMAGNAKINLNFEFNGQKVALHVDEKDGFVIEMNNGMKFSIPVEEKKAS